MRILILDDHRLFLEGLHRVLEGLDDGTQIVEAQTTQRALSLLDDGQRFDVILTDLSLPDLDGFAFLKALRERRTVTPVVIISASDNERDIRRALDHGALGFIPKSLGSRELRIALHQVLDGEIFVPAAYWDLVFGSLDRPDAPALNDGHDDGIGPRQLEVLQHMAAGRSNKQIATLLNITEATVKSHIGMLFRALHVRNRTACVREALNRNLVNVADL